MNSKQIEQAASYPYMIWDMDGTIVDSMPYWMTLSSDYIKSKGITPQDDLDELAFAMTLEESSAYFQKHYLPDMTVKQIVQEALALIEEEYRSIIPAKPFASAILKKAAGSGCRMCVLTTSDKVLVEAALKRIGFLDCFERILTVEDMGMDKRSGAIYEKTMEIMGFEPEKTLICEDAAYAVRAAAETKASVLVVRDAENQAEWEELCALADLAEE